MSDSEANKEFFSSFFFFSNFLSILVKRLGFGLSSGFAIISGVTWTSDPAAWGFKDVKE